MFDLMISSLWALIKKVCFLLLCVAAIVLGGFFAYENPETISPTAFSFELPGLSLGYYMVLILVIGLIIGVLISFWSAQLSKLKLKRELSKLKKELKSQALELRALKQAGVNTSSPDQTQPSSPIKVERQKVGVEKTS